MGTVSSSYLRAIFEGCVQEGAESAILMALIPGGARALENPVSRFPNPVPVDVLNLAARQTNDPAMGVKVGLTIRPSTFMDVGYALPFCENLIDVLATNRTYQSLTQQLGTTKLVMRGSSAWVEWSPLYSQIERHRHYVEMVFAAYAVIGRWLLWGEDNPVLSMHFRHSAPTEKTIHENVFTPNIFFDAEHDRVEFTSHLAKAPMPSRNREMMTFLRAKLDAQLTSLNKPVNVSSQVLGCIHQALQDGRPSISDIARILGYSERTLRRKLTEESQSFRLLLEQARKDICEVYMRSGEHDHAQIAQMLGYSDQSAYSRAFRAWFGMPPQAYKLDLSP